MKEACRPLPSGRAALLLAVSMLWGVTVAAQGPAPALEEAFARAPGYEFGQSRLALIVIADAVSDAMDDPRQQRELERRLVALLEDPDASRDCRGFACRRS